MSGEDNDENRIVGGAALQSGEPEPRPKPIAAGASTGGADAGATGAESKPEPELKAEPDSSAEADAKDAKAEPAAQPRPDLTRKPKAHDPASDMIRGETFRIMGWVTVGFAIFTSLVLIVPCWLLSNYITDSAAADEITRGCAIHMATHLFHVFCAYSVRFLGALVGGVIALSGGLFILNRLQDAVTLVGEQAQGLKVSLQTTSPGLAMVLLGLLLVLAAMYREQEFVAPNLVCTQVESSGTAGTGSANPSPSGNQAHPSPGPAGCAALLGDCDGGVAQEDAGPAREADR